MANEQWQREKDERDLALLWDAAITAGSQCQCRGPHRITAFQEEALRSIVEAGEELRLPLDLPGRSRMSFRALVNHGLAAFIYDFRARQTAYRASPDALAGYHSVISAMPKHRVGERKVAADAPPGRRPKRQR